MKHIFVYSVDLL